MVDVDNDNLKNFKNFLKVSYPNFKDIKTLNNPNLSVYDVIKNNQINLIVGDIRFFGVSSYQVIRNIYEMFPEVKLILYGTYNESDYLKRTLDYGVINYMFKPVKPIEFKKAMDNAINIFESMFIKKKEEDLLKNEYLEDIKLFEDKFINNVLFGYVKSDSELYRSFNYFKLNFFHNYCVCILRIDYFKNIISSLDEMEKHMLSFKLLSIINKIIGNSSKATISNFNTISIIMSGNLTLEGIISSCTLIKNTIYEKMQIRVTLGIGRIYDKPSDICVSRNEAEAALRYRFYAGYNNVIPICYVEPENNVTYRYPLDKEHRLVYAAVIGEYDYCQMLLHEILVALKQSGTLPENLVPKIIMDILISISRYASEQNILDNGYFSNFFSFKEALDIRDLDEAFNYLDEALKKFCSYVVSKHKEKDSELFDKAKQFAQKQYYETSSLTNVAVRIGTTPDYLNNLFLQRENRTFSEYITSVKIDVAKDLMQTTALNDDIVSIRSGFSDSKQFRAIFKQHENMFPHEYREKYGY